MVESPRRSLVSCEYNHAAITRTISHFNQPGWMKSGTMDGGSLNTAYISISRYLELIRLMLCQPYIKVANYLLKSLQGFSSEGIPVYAITIQVRRHYHLTSDRDGQLTHLCGRTSLKTAIQHTLHAACRYL